MSGTKKDVVEYRIYSLPVDLPVIVLTGEQWRISDQPSSRLHFHNCLEIGLCHSDSGYLRFEGEVVPFHAGDVFIIPRHVPHTTCSTPGCRSLWSYLFIDLDSISRSLLDRFQDAGHPRTEYPQRYIKADANSSERLHFLAHCLLAEAIKLSEENKTVLRLYASLFNAELARCTATAPKPANRQSKLFPLKPALEYIVDHYMEPCDTETLANMCHLSQTHFRRLFLKCIEQTPLQFVISTRIHQACTLLATTSEPVLSIAQAVGMPSASSFNRNFQQVVGMSPRQYRLNAEREPNPARPNGEVITYKGWTLPDK